jgi:hypothetical protein
MCVNFIEVDEQGSYKSHVSDESEAIGQVIYQVVLT